MSEEKRASFAEAESDGEKPGGRKTQERRRSRRSLTSPNLVVNIEEIDEDGPLGDNPLVELVAERLMKKVAWLTTAVKALHSSHSDVQGMTETDLQDLRIGQEKHGVDMGHLSERAEALEKRAVALEGGLRQVQFSAPSGNAGSGEESASAAKEDGEQPPSSHMVTNLMTVVQGLTEKLDHLQRDHQRLDSHIKHQAQQQEQKDIAQDELLAMELEALKREISTCVKTSTLEETRKLMTGKIQHMGQELKETLTGQNAEFMDGLIADSRMVQEQLKQVSEAISSQIKLLEDKIAVNQTQDDERAREVDERLLALEKLLEEVKSGTPKRRGVTVANDEEDAQLALITKRITKIERDLSITPSEVAPDAAPGNLDALIKRLSVLEQHVEKSNKRGETSDVPASGGKSGTSGADPHLLQQIQAQFQGQFQGLMKRVDTLEQEGKEVAELVQGGGNRTYLTEVEDETEKNSMRLGNVEKKVTSLETSIDKAKRDDRRSLDELRQSLASVQKTVQELKPNGGKSAPEDNPLAWLDEKVSEIAKREDRRDKGEIPKRVGLLEVHQRDFDYRLNAVRGDVGDEIEAQLEKVTQRFREEQKDIKTSTAISSTSTNEALKQRPTRSEKEKSSGVTDEIWEEIQRLRCLIECMETAVPLETRKAMEFFKRSPGTTAPNSTNVVELESKLFELKQEIERKTTQYHTSTHGEINNVLRIVKGMEKETEILSAKMEDVCNVHPKVLNALEVVEAILGDQETDAKAIGGERTQYTEASRILRQQVHSAVESLRTSGNKTLLMTKDFDAITQEFREDFDHNIGRMRAEFSSALCTKADASDVASLFGMFEAIRSQSTTPGPSRPQTTDQYSRVPSRASSRGSMRPTNPRTTHIASVPRSRASTPLDQTNPGQRGGGSSMPGLGQSQSTGRLPTLSK